MGNYGRYPNPELCGKHGIHMFVHGPYCPLCPFKETCNVLKANQSMILPPGHIGPIMGKEAIDEQIAALKKVGAELIAAGPEACRQFLIDAGIIKDYGDRLKKSEWIVLPISILTARMLVEKYHYAKSGSNTAVYTHGLFRKDESFLEAHCLGVAWWIPPTKSSAIATYPEGDWQKVLSLHRTVVVPGVPKNACSFLLSKSVKMIDKAAWECLVTYADTWQNHEGTIYKASNWEYMGMTKPEKVFVGKTGKMMGRKRGQRTLTNDQMKTEGFSTEGNYAKHKFRKILVRSK